MFKVDKLGLRVVLFGFILLLAGSEALAGEISAATWTPGTGDAVALSEANPTTISSVVSRGKVKVEAVFATPVSSAQFAYAVKVDQDNFSTAGGVTYFTIPPSDTTIQAWGGGSKATGTIYMASSPCFMNMGAGQALQVWVGTPGTMIVNPDTGVTNAQDSANYPVNAAYPTRSIILCMENFHEGIAREGAYTVTVFRNTNGDAESCPLTYSGSNGLLGSLDRPSSVVIPSGEYSANFALAFHPDTTLDYPTGGSQLGITATIAGDAVSTSLKFAGHFLVEEGHLLAARGGTTYGRRCNPAAVAPPTNYSGPETCGECGDHPPCQHGLPADSTGTYLWYIPYRCPTDSGNCVATTSQLSGLGSSVVTTYQACTYYTSTPGGKFAGLNDWEHQGTKCCYVSTVGTTTIIANVADCHG